MANPNPKITLSIDLAQQSYPIYIGHNLLVTKNISPFIVGRQVLIVTNETVAPLYLKDLDFLQTQYECKHFILPDGEVHKTHENWYATHDFLIKNQYHRDSTIIALGGGVIGDLTGFVAATYQRGVNLIQIPTTLLSQVDSSVGGKTAINHPLGKNMIGSFYHPSVVFIDLTTLKTLPMREINAGFAEIIKYGLLSSDEFLAAIANLLQDNDYFASGKLSEIIGRCCQIKAEFVNKDEKEKGLRALLNLGHTFAHAIETYTNYDKFLHGEAVAIGLYCAAVLSHLCGYANKALITKVDGLLKLANLPRRIEPEWSPEALLKAMKQDKKIKDNHLRMILMKDVGQCFIDEAVSDEQILKTLLLATEGVNA
jgi:3-dehydroquinate synthase